MISTTSISGVQLAVLPARAETYPPIEAFAPDQTWTKVGSSQ